MNIQAFARYSRAFLPVIIFVLTWTEGFSQCSPAAPSAAFSFLPDSFSCADAAITFRNASAGQRLSYQWTFTDTTTGLFTSNTQQQPVLSFSNSTATIRVMRAKLLVTDSCGTKDSVTKLFYIQPALKGGFRIVGGHLGCDSAAITFQDTSYGHVLSYRWLFDDPASGTADTSTARNPVHRFGVGAAVDTFRVRLIVSDTCNRRDTIYQEVYISPYPVAAFTFAQDSSCSGVPVDFTNASAGTGLAYRWDFGDAKSGSSNGATDANPSHTFDSVGTSIVSYAARLVVTNNFGCSDSVTHTLYQRQHPDASVEDIAVAQFTQCNSNPVFFIEAANISSTFGTNRYYLVDWGDTSGIDSLVNFVTDTNTYVGAGLYKLRVTAVDNAGCRHTQTYDVFNGSNPSGGLNSPGTTINLCAPVTLGFPVTGIRNNPLGTTYTVEVNDGSSPVVYQHPPPDTIYYSFTRSSCGSSFNSGATVYNNSLAISLVITNPCGFTAASIVPITISKKPDADMAVSHDTACRNITRVDISDITSGASYVAVSGQNITCDTNYRRYWTISPATHTLVSGTKGTSLLTTISGGSSSLGVRFTDTGEYTVVLYTGFPNSTANKCGYDSVIRKIYVIDTVRAAYDLALDPTNGCLNNTITPRNLSTGPNKTYQWTVTPNSGYTLTSGTLTSFEPVFRFHAAGNYELRLTVRNSCNEDDTFTTVTIRDIPMVALPPNASYCGPQAIAFNNANTPHTPTYNARFGTISGYRWRIYGPAGFSFSGGTDSLSQYPQVNFADTGVYRVYLYAINQCGISQPDSQQITIRPVPQMSAGTGSLLVCPADSIRPVAFASLPPGATFAWSNSNTANGLGSSGTGNLPRYRAPGNVTGNTISGTITVTPTLNGCSGTPVQLTIGIKPQPVATPISSIIVCPGDSVRVPAFGANPGGAAFAWTNSNTAIGLAAGGNGNIATYAAPFTGTSIISGMIRFQPTLNGCVGTADSFEISIRPSPVMVRRNDTILCANTLVTLPAFNSTPGGATFTWSNTDTLTGIAAGGTGNIPTFTTRSNTSGVNIVSRIIVVPTFNSCTGTPDTFLITVRPQPVMLPVADTTVCPGDSVRMAAFAAQPTGTVFTWTNSQGSIGLGTAGTGNIPRFAAGANTSGGSITGMVVVVPTLNGCAGVADTFAITVRPTPQAVAMTDRAFCPLDSVKIPAFSSIPAGASFAWINNNAATGLGLSGSGNVADYAAPANGTANAFVSRIRFVPLLNGCAGLADSFSLTIYSTPAMQPVSDQAVCPGDSVRIPAFASVPAGATFAWSNSNVANGLGASGNGSIATYPAPANFSGSNISGLVRVVPTRNGCVGVADTFGVNIRPQPPIQPGLADTLCQGQSATIGAAAVNRIGYQWTSSPAGFTSQQANPVVTPLATTLYRLSILDSVSRCSNTDSVQILVDPVLAGNTLTAPQTICAGQQADTLRGSQPSGGSNSYGFQWQESTDSATWTTIPGATARNYDPGTPIQTTFFRRIVLSRECTDTSARVRILVLPGITGNTMGVSQTICAFFSADTLRGSVPNGGTGSYTYQWQQTADTLQAPVNIQNATGINHFPGILSATTYYRRVAASGTCDHRSSWVKITVEPKPVAGFVSTNACFGFDNSFADTSRVTGSSIQSRYWQFGDGDTSSLSAPLKRYAIAGSYPVKLMVTTPFGCRDSVSRNVFVNPRPVAAFDSSNVCFGLQTAFVNHSAVSTGSIAQYRWFFGDGDSSGQVNPGHFYPAANTYGVKLIVRSDSGCTDSLHKTVLVYPKPIAGFVSEDKCFGQASAFTDTSSVASGNIIRYSWNFGNGDTSTVKDPLKTYSFAGTYTVRHIVTTDRGCLDTLDRNVIIYPSIASNSIAAGDTICAGAQTMGFTGSNPTGGTGTYAYRWQQSPDSLTWTNISGATNSNLPALTLISTTYFRRIVISSPCDTPQFSISNVIRVLVTPGIANNAISASQTICAFFSADTLRGSIPNGGTGSYTYQWQQTADTLQAPVNIQNAAGIHHFPGTLSSTLYYRRVAASGTCDNRSNWVKITVEPKPAAGFISTNACFGFDNSFADTSRVAGSSIQSRYWQFGDGDTSSLSAPLKRYAVAGSYPVKLVVTTPFGCRDSLSRNVYVNPRPVVAFDSSNVCFGLQTAFVNHSTVSTGSIAQYRWFFGDGDSSSQVSPGHFYPAANTYGVKLIVRSDSGCTDSLHKTALVYPKPIAGFVSEDKCFGQANAFTDTSSVASGSIIRYSWNFGNGDTSTTKDPSRVYAAPGTYTVRHIVTTDRGCLDTLDRNVIIYPAIASNSITASDTICAGGQTKGFTGSNPTGGTGTYAYRWQQSPDSLTWTNISGATNSNLAALTLTSTTYFRRIVTSSPCDTPQFSTSNVILVLVTAGIANNTVGSDQVICYAQVPDSLTGSLPTGGTGNFTYQWEQSANGTSWSNISAATGRHYSPGSLTDTVYYRRTVYSQACSTQSNTVKIAVKPLPVTGFTHHDVCLLETTVFTDTSTVNQGTLQGWRWDFGDGDTSALRHPQHTYATAGTYRVKLVALTSSGCVDSVSKNVVVYEKPVASFSQNNICDPFAMQFTDASQVANGALTAWKWYFGDGDSAGIQHPLRPYATDGAYTTTLVVTTNNGCKDTVARQVRVFAKPVPDFGFAETCFPNGTTFRDSTTIPAGSIARRRWDFGDGDTSSLKDPVHLYAATGTYQVKLVTVSDSGCTDSISQSITYYALPVVGFTFDTLSCLNAAVPFTNTTTGGARYSWDFGNGDTSQQTNGSVTYASTGIYPVKLRAFSAFGCADSLTRNIRIIAPPQTDLDLSLDSGCGPLLISFTNNTVADFETYLWDFGNGTGSSTRHPAAISYPPSLFADTTYYIRLQATNKCGTTSDLDSVLVLPVPTARLGKNVNSGCSPLPLGITNLSVGRATRFSWDYGDGDTSAFAGPQQTHTYLTSAHDTVYHIRLIAYNQCGTDTARDSILVKPNTVTAFFNTDTTRGCVPLEIKFTDLSTGGTFISYDFGDGNNSVQRSPVHTFVTPGIYHIQQLANNGCSYDTASVQVEVLPGVPAFFTVDDPTVCVARDLQFTNTTGVVSGVLWRFGDGDSSTLNDPSHAYAAAGKYAVSLTVFSAVNGCPAHKTDTVTIFALPVPAYTLPVSNGCPPFTATFTNTSGNARFHTWDFGDGNTSGQADPQHIYILPGVYPVKLVSSNLDGCVDSLVSNITVHPLPAAAFALTYDTECDSPARVSFANNSTGAVSYTWHFGDGGTSLLNQPAHVYAGAGAYPVLLEAENSFGCRSVAMDTVRIYTTPAADFTFNPGVGCQPLEVTFANRSANGLTWLWRFGDGDSSLLASPVHVYDTFGVFSVTLIASGGGPCKDTLVQTSIIRVDPKPVAAFSFVMNDSPRPKGEATFTDQSTFGAQWYWDFGDGKTSTDRHPVHRYQFPGNYTVMLIVTSASGCVDTVVREVDASFFKGLYVPNAFTPGYGMPEVREFKPVGVSLKTYRLRIFDTYGNLLWESTALDQTRPAEGWNGNVKGVLSAQDVYVWKIEAEFLDGTTWPGMQQSDGKFRREGTVTLIR